MAGHHDRSEEGPPAQVLDHDLVRCVGRGSFGEVWLGRTVIGGYRAVKIVYRRNFEDARPYEREFAGVRKFEPISRTHPGLVAVLQVGRNEEKGYFYYVMELADDLIRGQDIEPSSYLAKNLKQYLAQRGRLPVWEALQIAVGLADSLAHIHGKRLVHRDIKPSNIIFVHGVPKFADIGLVTRIDEATGPDGTLGYVPPEGPGAPTADIFAFGKVLYQLAMGKTLHQYPELPVQVGESPDTEQLLCINRIIRGCCEPKAQSRLQTAAELLEQLRDVQRTLSKEKPKRKTRTTVPRARKQPLERKPRSLNFRIVILYAPESDQDRALVRFLSEQFSSAGFDVHYDKREAIGIHWAADIQGPITKADAAIILLSDKSVTSEMLGYEVELAYQSAQHQQQKPRLLPVRVQYTGALPSPLAGIIDPLPAFHWEGAETSERLIDELSRALEESLKTVALWPRVRLESVGGAVPVDSHFYVIRPTDHEFENAVERRDSIVLVKGARQMGKTSLLARGLHQARESGAKGVCTDFQKLSSSHLSSIDSFFLSIAEFLADQLALDIFPEDFWDKRRSANTNFERFLKRQVLPAAAGHLVWGLDEVDRLFTCPFGSEVFGLFRSWHNERALNPAGPWSHLTMVMSYATEAHLFITDVNQSPFNVGTRLRLEDFTLKEVAELNRRHGGPLKTDTDLKRLYALLGGQPYLIRRALSELVVGHVTFEKLLESADQDEGIFGDHLRRMLVLLGKDPVLAQSITRALQGDSRTDTSIFYRLRSAGIVSGESVGQLRLRCELYGTYFRRHLK